MQQYTTLGKVVAFMLCLIALVSIRAFSKLPLGVGPVHYVAGFTLIALSIVSLFRDQKLQSFSYTFLIMYLIWTAISIYRGWFDIQSGFIFNQFLHGILYVLSPITIFLFASPMVTIQSFQVLNLFMVVLGFAFYNWNMRISAYPFWFTPFFYLYLCFLFKIPKKWRILTLICVGMVLMAVDNSSSMLKTVVAIGTLFVFMLPKKLRTLGVHIGHWFFYLVAVVLLYLGFTGQYNFFSGKSSNSASTEIVIGAQKEEGKSSTGHADTRTFIYEEMITSAFIYDHFWVGRTPARGYYSAAFSKDADKSIVGIDSTERFGSEVANLNTFLWLGMIGLILFTLVFLQGTCLAMYCSNNIYVKCIAMGVAFHWAYGWIENMNQFMLIDLMIYFNLAICYSPYFRKMSDLEFECWFKSLFGKIGKVTTYQKYHALKILLKYNKIKDVYNFKKKYK